MKLNRNVYCYIHNGIHLSGVLKNEKSVYIVSSVVYVLIRAPFDRMVITYCKN